MSTAEPVMKIELIVFKPNGKYYTTEYIDVTYKDLAKTIYPRDLKNHPFIQKWFASHPDWYMLIVSQNPWGYPEILTYANIK